eukprot:tig00020675_g12655.t1
MDASTTTMDASAYVFFATKSGKRYHIGSCDALKSKSDPMTPAEAESGHFKGKRLTPCKICINNAWLIKAKAARNTFVPVPLTGNVKQQLYPTKTGQKYHHKTCPWLGATGLVLGPRGMDDLESRGYQPCAVCLKPEAGYESRNVKVNEALRITRATAVGGASAAGPAQGDAGTSGAGSSSGDRREAMRRAQLELEEMEAGVARKKAEIQRLSAPEL